MLERKDHQLWTVKGRIYRQSARCPLNDNLRVVSTSSSYSFQMGSGTICRLNPFTGEYNKSFAYGRLVECDSAGGNNELNSGSEDDEEERRRRGSKKLVSFFVKGNLIFSPVVGWRINRQREGEGGGGGAGGSLWDGASLFIFNACIRMEDESATQSWRGSPGFLSFPFWRIFRKSFCGSLNMHVDILCLLSVAPKDLLLLPKCRILARSQS